MRGAAIVLLAVVMLGGAATLEPWPAELDGFMHFAPGTAAPLAPDVRKTIGPERRSA